MAASPLLAGIFPGRIVSCTHLESSQVPEKYVLLLQHKRHMTLTMEETHGFKVTLEVIQSDTTSDTMSREIVLRGCDNGVAVLYAIAKVYLNAFAPAARDDIVAAKEPLGHILVKHKVEREVFFESLLEVDLTESLRTHLNISSSSKLYGRLAYIVCNGQRGIDLLEVVLPIEA